VVSPTTAVAFGPGILLAHAKHEVLHFTHCTHVSGYVEGNSPLVPCDHNGIDQYILTIDHRLLLATDNEGTVLAPSHLNAPDLNIDLYDVQVSFRRRFFM
jgi:hypothetical protein